MAISWNDAVKYATIYSKHGLESMIKDSEAKITQFEKDRAEVAAGEKWNPLMKEGNIRELNKDIALQRENIVTFKAALKVRESMEKQGHFEPIEMEIDGMLVTEK